eukprot:902580-Amphidinium_carterae.3
MALSRRTPEAVTPLRGEWTTPERVALDAIATLIGRSAFIALSKSEAELQRAGALHATKALRVAYYGTEPCSHSLYTDPRTHISEKREAP